MSDTDSSGGDGANSTSDDRETDSNAEEATLAGELTPDGHPTCPFCGSDDTERESKFGSEISKVQYYCADCRTVFERIKYDGKQPDTGR